METSKTNKGLFAIAILSVVGYLAIKNVYKLRKDEKMIGQSCNPFGGGPDGIVVYDYPLIRNSDSDLPVLSCKRCVDPEKIDACRDAKL
jgi:hypothetical protein